MNGHYCFVEHLSDSAVGEGLRNGTEDDTKMIVRKVRKRYQLVGGFHPVFEDVHGPLFYIKKRRGVKTPRYAKHLEELAGDLVNGYYSDNYVELKLWLQSKNIPAGAVLVRIPS